MGKLILVCGQNNSGKSCYAEVLAAKMGTPPVYIATMIPCTEENRLRIQKHIRQRAGLRFRTQECPYQLGDVCVEDGSSVLLEDVSNLLANAMFEKGQRPEAVLADILALQERCGILTAVTIAHLRPDGYDAETAAYINSLNDLNKQLWDKADAVVEMCAGSPCLRKGEIPDVD